MCVLTVLTVGLRSPWTVQTAFKSEFEGFQLGYFAENVSFISDLLAVTNCEVFCESHHFQHFGKTTAINFDRTPLERQLTVRQSCIAKTSSSCPCSLCACDIKVCTNSCKCNVHFIISRSQNNMLQAIAYRLHVHRTADMLYNIARLSF